MSEAEAWRSEFTAEQQAWLNVVWGKSNVGGQVHLLIQHMLDSLAVGELMWDRFLARSLRERIDRVAGQAGGRALFAWICGVHDVGKATPVFQKCNLELGDRVNAAGLAIGPNVAVGGWRHDAAGGSHLFTELPLKFGVGRRDEAVGWLWPLIAGHHGRIPNAADVNPSGKRRGKHGVDPSWVDLRTALLSALAIASGHASLAEVRPSAAPSRGDQLAIAGLMIMADWIASSSQFSAVAEWDGVSLESARSRASTAWENLGLRGGWNDLSRPPEDILKSRFANSPRAVQSLAIDLAKEVDGPGLMVVEAPMGEGKTELALAVAEVFGHRLGVSGVAVAMPTQATCDAMFSRVQPWLETLGGNSQLALLHGKRLVSDDWKQLVRQVATRPSRAAGKDDFDLQDSYSTVSGVCEDCDANDAEETGVHAAAEWFLGRYRGMLTPHFVGTIDQLLFAATRTKFVSLRFSGLVGKVVIVDEVHAVDVYMAEFLEELLKWLGSAGIPVVLLSATLAPIQRQRLVRSYLGLLPSDELDDESARSLSERCGYPQITVASCCESNDNDIRNRMVRSYSSESTRPHQQVELNFITGFDAEADARLIETIELDLADGGVALVIRNTVNRAQDLFKLLFARYGDEVRLLHSRFTAGHRAEDTAEIVRLIGPPRPSSSHGSVARERPNRLIVVATQVAEQSFDVDADVLFTDLAPIDLVLQRIGRLHRHDRDRPGRLSAPKVYVTAMPPVGAVAGETRNGLTDPGGSAVYGTHHLLRSATLLRRCEPEGISLPRDIPRLVDAAYGAAPPMLAEWVDVAMASEAEQAKRDREREVVASAYRLDPIGAIDRRSLEGLHTRANTTVNVESNVRVRDPEGTSLEIALLRRDERGYYSLDGNYLGPNCDLARDDPALVVSSLVRVPDMGRKASSDGSERELHRQLRENSVNISGWSDHPWLRNLLAIVMGNDDLVRLPGFHLSYDRRCGLVIERPV